MGVSFSLKARLKSVGYALNGVRVMLRTQHNAQIHLAATLGIAITGVLLHVTRTEWCFTVLAVVAVWTAEALNTAFEFLCDVASPDFHPLVEKAKDVSAGAVLITTFGAVLLGTVIYIPRILNLFGIGIDFFS